MSGSATSNEFQERRIDIDGWPVKLTSYRAGNKFVCQADNVSPGATLARFSADSAEAAESQAISKARHLLSKTRKREV